VRRDTLLIGRCLKAHGVEGEVLVQSLTDDAGRFAAGLRCLVVDDADVPSEEIVVIERARSTPKGVLCAFESISDREAARALSGRYLAVRREDALPLEDGMFYTGDLIGCRVIDDDRGALGVIVDVVPIGGTDTLVIASDGERDLFVPFQRSIVRSVDIDGDEVRVRLPAGLYEIYRR
jgi:16S rRNA processing protein RimM